MEGREVGEKMEGENRSNTEKKFGDRKDNRKI